MNGHFITLVFLCLVSINARANQLGFDHARLKVLARSSAAAIQSNVVYQEGSSASTLPPDAKSLFETIAQKQSQIWADTILENDYRLGSRVRLDRVEVLYSNQDPRPLAYRISYSARAWYTADCPAHRSLETCEEGRIKESSFVSISFSSWLTDESATAEFVN